MTNWIFYHNDLDGLTAAAIMRQKLVCKDADNSDVIVNTVETTYGMDIFEGREFGEEDHVYFVDFCPARAQFDELTKKVAEIIILDHHDRPDMEGAEYNGEIDTISGRAGCEMTWEYCFGTDPMPEFVRHIGRYDVWDHKHPNTLPLYYGAMFLEQDPTLDEMWKDLLWPEPKFNEEGQQVGLLPHEQLINMGGIALMYRSTRDEHLLKAMYIAEVEGKKVLTVNAQCEDSYSFTQWFTQNPDEAKEIDAVAWYYRMPKGQWKYSIRSNKEGVDVGELARSFGGGGREGTAGWVSDERVF